MSGSLGAKTVFTVLAVGFGPLLRPPEGTPKMCSAGGLRQSGREDLNLRPHGPEPCALAKLSYAPCDERYGFYRIGAGCQSKLTGFEARVLASRGMERGRRKRCHSASTADRSSPKQVR